MRLIWFLGILFALCTVASAQGARSCDITNEDHARVIAAGLNATLGPRLIEDAAIRHSINELYRDATGRDDEHTTIWWGEAGDGMGFIIVGSNGTGCMSVMVPAQYWPAVLRVIIGQPV